MKLNILTTIFVATCFMSNSALASIELYNKDGHKLESYGRVYALNYVGDHDNFVDGQGDQTAARISLSGETVVNDLITGYGFIQWQTEARADYSSETRYAYAGLNFGKYGSIDYGRNDGIFRSVLGFTDVLPEWGGDGGNNDLYVMGGRTSAVLTYYNNSFFDLIDGIRFGLQYADNGNATSKLTSQGDSREAYGAMIDWDIFDSGIAIGTSYTRSSGNDYADAWNAGIRYSNGDLYLGALYLQARHKDSSNLASYGLSGYDNVKLKGMEFVVQYGFDLDIGRITPSLAYLQHKAYGDGNSRGYMTKYIEAGFTYDVNKNLTAVIDYKINLLDTDDAGAHGVKGNTKSTVAIGMMYQF